MRARRAGANAILPFSRLPRKECSQRHCLLLIRNLDIQHSSRLLGLATPSSPVSAWNPRDPQRSSSTIDQNRTYAQQSAKTQQKLSQVSALPYSGKLGEAERLVADIINSDTRVPSEPEIIEALQACDAAARSLKHPSTSAGPSATASLLSLDDRPSRSSSLPYDRISQLSYRLIKHPTVFISPKALSAYIDIQCLLENPTSFPEVFALYAQKPVPRPSRDGTVVYVKANPNNASAAIDQDVANTALGAAVLKKDLFAALDIIDTTFSTTAYQRARFLRKALPPVAGFGMAPLAAYVLATRFSEWQDTMEPSVATTIAGAGFLTYFGVIGTVGYVAVTTANDQMDRVTWAAGTPLYLRWLREDERAAVDRVAGAWGLKDLWKRGEEEGEEWEFLRDWVGYRGMILDKTELMEGME